MDKHKIDALACMVIHRAVIDAAHGSAEAKEWVLTTGLEWCDALDVWITERDVKARLDRKREKRRFVRGGC